MTFSGFSSGVAHRCAALRCREVDVNLRDESKMTPLLVAAEFGSRECFSFLFDLPATDKLAINSREMTCLHLACKTGCTSVVKVNKLVSHAFN